MLPILTQRKAGFKFVGITLVPALRLWREELPAAQDNRAGVAWQADR